MLYVVYRFGAVCCWGYRWRTAMNTSALAAACDCCGVTSAALAPRLNSEPKAPARLRLSSVRYPIVTPGDMSSADLDLKGGKYCKLLKKCAQTKVRLQCNIQLVQHTMFCCRNNQTDAGGIQYSCRVGKLTIGKSA